MKNSKRVGYLMLSMPILYAMLAFGIAILVKGSGIYPSGKDTMGWLYRGDALYQAVCNGDVWPMFDPNWYNGMELMRCFAPVPAYLLAACQLFGGGSPMAGYLIFIMSLFFLGAVCWLYAGVQAERPFLGAFLGILWFFTPNNLFTLFYEGDLARSVCIAILPMLLYWVYHYLKTCDWHAFLWITVFFALISLCQPGYAGMVFGLCCLYLLIDIAIYRTWRRNLQAVFSLALGFSLAGFWVVPSLAGRVSPVEPSEILADFFQSMWLSLNPIARIQRGAVDSYFGLAAALLAVFGIFLSKKKSMPGFWVGILALAFSSETFYLFLSVVPGGEYLQMLRFISIALGMALFSFLIWDTLKKGWVLLFAVLLVLDAVPSLQLILGNQSGLGPEWRLAYYSEKTLVGRAKEVTGQRLALLDESSLGSTSAYLVSGYGKPVATSYGAVEEAARTVTNFKQVDRALEEGNYLYMFDRCKELGNDTVIIQLGLVNDLASYPTRKMDQAAIKTGYRLMAANEDYRLYYLRGVEGNWGTVSNYRAIGIGTAAPALSRQFPVVEEVGTTNLNDFTFEELAGYDLVYLAGFTYDDKPAAEQLITDLSEAGVRIVIAADGIPDDRGSQNQSFLGVVCNGVTFSQGYPDLDTVDGVLETDLFPDGHREWSTIYLDGLDEVWGTVQDLDWKLPFFGTVKNDNIVLVGLNLTYYYSITLDQGVGKLLGRAMDISPDELPDREVVPLQLQCTSGRIVVTAGKDHVNTGLAYHDSFQSVQALYGKNHLAYVMAGTTEISLGHPYLGLGAAVSIAALCVALAYARHLRRQGERKVKGW